MVAVSNPPMEGEIKPDVGPHGLEVTSGNSYRLRAARAYGYNIKTESAEGNLNKVTGNIRRIVAQINNDNNYGTALIDSYGSFRELSLTGDVPEESIKNKLGVYWIDESKYPKNRLRGTFGTIHIWLPGGWYQFQTPGFHEVCFWGYPNAPIDVYRNTGKNDTHYHRYWTKRIEDYYRPKDSKDPEGRKTASGLADVDISQHDTDIPATQPDRSPITGLIDYTEDIDYPSFFASKWRFLYITGCFFRIDLFDKWYRTRTTIRAPFTRLRLDGGATLPFAQNDDDIPIRHFFGNIRGAEEANEFPYEAMNYL